MILPSLEIPLPTLIAVGDESALLIASPPDTAARDTR